VTLPDQCRNGTPCGPAAAQDQFKEPEHHPAADFLRLLGKDPAQTWFRTIRQGKGANASRKGRDLHGLDLEALQRDNANGEAVYFVSGNSSTASGPKGGVLNTDITSCPALFAEWDDKPIEWQLQAWQALGLPEPTVMNLTGGKSVHCYWLLTEPMEPDQWQALQSRLIDHCGSDKQCKNPSRVMRLPGFAYIDKKTGKATGAVAEVVHTSGKAYTAAEIEACLPSLLQPVATGPAPATAPPPASTNSHKPRTLQEIEAAVAFIPQRVVGGNTYETCRRALCGCAAALAEIGLPEEQALDLLAGKWPDRADAQQALNSSTTREAASFWAIAREHGYDLRRKSARNKRQRSAAKTAAAAPPAPAQEATPASWSGLISRLPDGWVVTEAGIFPSKLSAGKLARMLENYQQLLRYNEMSMFCEVHTRKGWCAIVDADMDSAYVLLSQKGWIIGLDPITKAACHVARLQSFHPVRQYLLDLEQNSTVEAFDLDQVAPKFFRAEDPLHVAMVRKWLVGAVARAMEPGCQMDYCLVLQSRLQGLTKSTSLKGLASPDWFTSTVPDGDKDFLLNVHSCWIFELAELESVTGKRDAGRLKNLISTSTDMFRVPYGRTAERRKRGSVFAATVNDDTFLRDETGNRRYWVVPIDGSEPLDREGLKAARDGIWKAALAAWRAGELPMLSRAQEALSEIQNGEFVQSDPWLAMLQASMELGTDRPDCWSRPFSTAEALQAAGLKNREQITRADENRIAPLLRQLGFEKGKNPSTTLEGSRVRLWIPAQPAQPCTTSNGGGCAPPDPLGQNGSRRPAQPAQPISSERSATAAEQPPTAAAATPEHPYVVKMIVQVVHPPADPPRPTAATDSSPAQPLHNPPPRGCAEVVQVVQVVHPLAPDPWGEPAPATERKVVHLPTWWQPWIVRLVRLRKANPGHSHWQLANLLMGEQGIRTTPHDVKRMLDSWDEWSAENSEAA